MHAHRCVRQLTKMKTIIGTFSVKDANNQVRKVVISQELVMGKKDVVEGAVKHLNLDSQDGERVNYTDNYSKFRLDDGRELKKIGNIEISDSL